MSAVVAIFSKSDNLKTRSYMSIHALEIRVNRLKKQIALYANSPEHSFTLEPVATQTIERLRALEYYPLDMLMILDQIGCMRGWGHNDCAMIDWWVPCSIEYAKAEDRCVYELSDSNFTHPSSLLFFAWDCDASCWFYDITETPWKVVACDGLDPSIYNEYKERGRRNHDAYIGDWDGRVTPYPGAVDALSVIESWAFG